MASGSNRVQLNLLAKEFDISGNAGDDFNIAWVAVGIDTTGWTLECKIWLANALENGPETTTPPPVATISVTNTPGANSTLSIVIPSATTLAQKGVVLWMILKRTDASAVRTLSQGPVRPI